MKVGEYIRTDNGIAKVVEIVSDGQISVDFINGLHSQIINKNMINKHSNKISDIIERYDYVNSCKVMGIDRKLKKVNIFSNDYGRSFYNFINEKDVKTIVTHEQFKAIEYEVKE